MADSDTEQFPKDQVDGTEDHPKAALPSGAPDPVAPEPEAQGHDTLESVRQAAESLLDPAVLDAAVQAAIAKAAPTSPLVAEIAVQAEHVSALYEWVHSLYEMFETHFAGKLPMPTPPPKPGAGIGQ